MAMFRATPTGDVQLTAEEEAARNVEEQTWSDDAPKRAWAEVRTKRDNLLASSDFTQLDDSPKNKQAWKTYRVALRDITEQADPDNITWPVAPNY